MALEKKIITVPQPDELGRISVKQITKILEDGAIISETIHRHVIAPGDNISNEASNVQAVAAALWTPEVVADYQAMLEALMAAMGIEE